MRVLFQEPGTIARRRHRDREASLLRTTRPVRRRARLGACGLAGRPARLSADARPNGEVARALDAACRSHAAERRRQRPGTRSRASCTATIPPSRATTSWSRPTSASAACCASATAPTAGCCRTAPSCMPSTRSAAAMRATSAPSSSSTSQPLTGALTGAIVSVWNPFDVTDGRDPEPPEKIRRNAPEAYRARQLRAVTLADYVRRAEEVPGVSRAVARYAWTGSWRTVRIVDRPGRHRRRSMTRCAATSPAHLEVGAADRRGPGAAAAALRAARSAHRVCADEAYWREDLRFVLEQEFSDGWTSDGRRGFFHPDEWTFGQALHRSAIEGRIHARHRRQARDQHHDEALQRRRGRACPGSRCWRWGSTKWCCAPTTPITSSADCIRFEVQGGRQ